jgi:XapX domain-containing protein
MKPYLISLGVGVLAGLIYSVLGVRSPAPPVIALVGLFGMLLGEQAVPLARSVIGGTSAPRNVRHEAARQVLGPHAGKASKPENGA